MPFHSSHGETVDGSYEWEVESPITFSYRVRETADVLDPASDLLIFGHLKNEQELKRAKARTIKRVVVVDEQVSSLALPLLALAWT